MKKQTKFHNDKRKEFRVPDELLQQIETFCANNQTSFSDFIRIAAVEKIKHDTEPQYSSPLQENHFYNYIKRASINSPSLKSLLADYEKEN